MKNIEVNNLSKIFGKNPERGIDLVKEGYETGNIAEDSSLLRVVDGATEEDEELTEGVII